VVVIVAVVLLVAYGLLVFSRLRRREPTVVRLPRAAAERTWSVIGAGRSAVARLPVRRRPTVDDEVWMLEPLAAYQTAFGAARATVEALKADWAIGVSGRAEFEEVAVQALVAAHALRRVADTAGACADAYATVDDPRLRAPLRRPSPPSRHRRCEHSPSFVPATQVVGEASIPTGTG
jgi:hypothetical protein